MTREPDAPDGDENPLAGVLDRLLQRERGRVAAPSLDPAGERRTEPVENPAEPASFDSRRMIPVAALGSDRGSAAIRSAGQWAALLGRSPSLTDLCEPGPHDPGDPDTGPASAGGGRTPRASLPRAPERIRGLSVEVALAIFDRLRRHESVSDLLIVRIPVREWLALVRATFLSGTVVIPFEGTDADLHEALEVSRDILQSFLDVTVWPFSGSPRGMRRFLSSIGEHGGERVVPFDPGSLDLAAAIAGLRGPPQEGFLVGLLAPEPATLPPELLRIDSVAL